VALTLQAADQGDTTTIQQTLEEAQVAARAVNEHGVEEVVADKGYHSGGGVDRTARAGGQKLHTRTRAGAAELAGRG